MNLECTVDAGMAMATKTNKKSKISLKNSNAPSSGRVSLYVKNEDWEKFEKVALRARETDRDLTIPEFIARKLADFGNVTDRKLFTKKRQSEITPKYGTTVKGNDGNARPIDFKLASHLMSRLIKLADEMGTTKTGVIRYLISCVNEREGLEEVDVTSNKPEPTSTKRFDVIVPWNAYLCIHFYSEKMAIKKSKLFRQYFNTFDDDKFTKFYFPVPRGRGVYTRKFSNADNDPIGAWIAVSLKGNSNPKVHPELHYNITNPKTGIVYPCPPKGWKYPQESIQQLVNDSLIIWPKYKTGGVRQKFYEKWVKENYHISVSVYQDMFDKITEMAQRFKVDNSAIVRTIIMYMFADIDRKRIVEANSQKYKDNTQTPPIDESE
jgi:hypothetical protein